MVHALQKGNDVIRHPLFPVLVLVLLLLIAAPIMAHFWMNPVEYNQFVIQGLEWKYGVATPEIISDSLRSAYFSGLNQLIGNPIRTPPEFSIQEETFAFVFSNIPNEAIVYPTEGFYYYNFIHPQRGKISGNMRIADLDKGVASIAYFTAGPQRETIIFEMNAEKGMTVHVENTHSYHVTYRGKTVHFKIPTTAETAPTETSLLPEEEFVGQIHDESGIRLFLIYNHRTHAFYEYLNEENGITDTLTWLNDAIAIGSRTNFAYYHDAKANRKILIGVFLPNVEANNFFDGPGDQVPFRANIKEKINAAYPNTLLEDGTDAHGVYLGRDYWVRIAISPYDRYGEYETLYIRSASCQNGTEGTLFWTCLTKEWWNTPEWRKEMYRLLLTNKKITFIPQWEDFTMADINGSSAGTTDSNQMDQNSN